MKDIVVTICCSCDYYEEAEINELIRIMDETEKLPMYSRKKLKGDNYLRCESYEKAIEEYQKILSSDEILEADDIIYGQIFHNMAVAYVNIGEFKKAAELFLKAYEKNKEEATLKQCLFAFRLCKDVENWKKVQSDLQIPQEKQEQMEQEYARAMESSSQSKRVLYIERLRNLLRTGNVEEYYDKVHQIIVEWKEEYRRQISV